MEGVLGVLDVALEQLVGGGGRGGRRVDLHGRRPVAATGGKSQQDEKMSPAHG
jgi:hypothetical protein